MDINKDTDLSHEAGWEGVRVTLGEATALTDWIAGHKAVCKKVGDIVIAQTGLSGIGANTVVRCSNCGEGADVTDYGIW